MNSMNSELLELSIWKALASRRLSISHDHNHIERVLVFARQLQMRYGGDLSVLTAAAILHDLGRSEPELHGQASTQKSLEEAKRFLSESGLREEQVVEALRAIDEHDKPGHRPSTLEGRILSLIHI